jgi:hypothetical protein
VTKDERSLELLKKSAAQFRFYERNHRAKTLGLPRFGVAEQATLARAAVNAEHAAELEAHIRFLEDDGA